MSEVQRTIPLFEDEQQRIIAATIEGMRIVCLCTEWPSARF